MGTLIAGTATCTESIRINNDSAAHYSYEQIHALGAVLTTTTSGAVTWWVLHSLAAGVNTQIDFTAEITNLTGLRKQIFIQTGFGGATLEIVQGQSSETTEINRIDMLSNEANGLLTDSTITLYGMR